jgi:hypothetical protein
MSNSKLLGVFFILILLLSIPIVNAELQLKPLSFFQRLKQFFTFLKISGSVSPTMSTSTLYSVLLTNVFPVACPQDFLAKATITYEQNFFGAPVYTACSNQVTSSTCVGAACATCGITFPSTGAYLIKARVLCSSGVTFDDTPLSVTVGASCVSTCTTLGAKQCSGTGYQTCQTVGSCKQWSSTVSCGTGYTCSAGNCISNCVSTCSSTEAGKTYCSADGYPSYRTCNTVQSGCYQWGTVNNCASGQVCTPLPPSTGSCIASCTSTCSYVGQTQCSTATKYQTCTQSGSCLVWSTATSCSTGNSCSGGACVSCSSCSSGERTCYDSTQYRACVLSSGCYVWGATTSCGTNMLCSGSGSCVQGSGCQYNNPACGPTETCVSNQCFLKSGCDYNNPACVSPQTCVANVCTNPPYTECGGPMIS